MGTENINLKTVNIDKCPTVKILKLINDEDKKISKIVSKLIPQIARAVDRITDAIQNGGRLIYCGAGTSGRLAVADAAELYPTYGLSAGTVIAVIAGGAGAIVNAQENCEDKYQDGVNQCIQLNVNEKDIVMGISASGGAAYICGFLEKAKEKKAGIVTLTNNADTKISRLADVAIEALTGAEVIQGSTRMKAGTSQKMILTMLSTAVCVRLGRVYQNMMTDMVINNAKLKERAIGMIIETTKETGEKAEQALIENNMSIRKAIESILGEKK